MLYQTHHPNFFQFQAPTTVPPSETTATPLSSSSFVLQEMVRIGAALKTSLTKELALKLSTQAVLEDICAVNFQNGAPPDDFSVDDLLDFSDKDGFVEQQEPRDEEEQKKPPLPVSPKEEETLDESLNFDDLGPIPSTELAVLADDLANLEWLSHFVEDSFSHYSTPFSVGALPVKDSDSEPKPPSAASPCFKTPVPAKARSKRTRSGGRVWTFGSSLSESSSSSTTSSSTSPASPCLINPASLNNLGPAEPFPNEKPQKKKQKKKSLTDGFNVVGGKGILFARRCSHCGVQKTPQWRAGPLGPKTLCNACGVRYKSGRLFPEYRPACSPTFSSELHSNHHRKVLEMRRKKELLVAPEPGLAPPVLVFD